VIDCGMTPERAALTLCHCGKIADHRGRCWTSVQPAAIARRGTYGKRTRAAISRERATRIMLALEAAVAEIRAALGAAKETE
jgi:hypothetical protein